MAVDPIKSLTVAYRAGERIVVAGEQGACLFVVQAGAVRLSRRGNASLEPVEIARLEKGDVFGEAALLDGRPYGIDADAMSDCEVLELGPQTFQKMLKARPEIAVRVLKQLSSRLEGIERRLVEDAMRPAAGSTAPPRGTIPPAAHAPHDTPAAAPPRPVVEKTRNVRLVLEEGGVVFPLKGPEMLLGRYDPVTEIQPEIDLGPLDTKRSVSRRHARLTEKGGSWYLAEEGGALNGTFVNGIKLLQGKGAPLTDGDVVSVGMVRLIYKEN